MGLALNDLYNAIDYQLRSIYELKWIDIDMGQLDKDGASYPVEYPAAFLRIENISWKDIDADNQLGVVHFTIKIAFQFTNEDDFNKPVTANTEVQLLHDILNKIDVAMRNIRGDNHSFVKRFNDSLIATKPDALLWIYLMEWKANVQSNNGDLANPDLVIVDYTDVENNNQLLARKRYNIGRRSYE